VVDALWLRENPRTCSATVVAAEGPRFALDRSIFCPGASRLRHPQPGDRGVVWLGGDKRRLQASEYRSGELWHRLAGAEPPPVGAAVRCHLDVERRIAAERAHVSMHLLLSHLSRERTLRLLEPPRVIGGGQFRLTLDPRLVSQEDIARLIGDVQASAAKALPIDAQFAILAEARSVDPQPFEDGWAVDPSAPARLVRIGSQSLLPCDAPFPPRTNVVGAMALRRCVLSRGRLLVEIRCGAPGLR
jgi:Ser-tRNA(Ala) deacylase AlaX